MRVLLVVLAAVVALFVLGTIVVGTITKLVWWALIGLAIGGLARLALPGRQPIGLLATAGGGIAGSLLGGVIADAADLGRALQYVVAIAVAAVIVAALSARAARAARRDEHAVAVRP